MTTTNDERQSQEEQLAAYGKVAYSAIAEMVAALECDYERLQELRDECDDLREQIRDADEEASEEEDTALAIAAEEIRDELQGQLDDLTEELADLEDEANDCEDEDEARRRIEEDALSVQVRSGWQSPGETLAAEEFEILLTTGGPAARIRGELNEHNEPCRAWLEVQDWFTSWRQVFEADSDTLLTYCQCFYFGE